jgi:hypothetical protein
MVSKRARFLKSGSKKSQIPALVDIALLREAMRRELVSVSGVLTRFLAIDATKKSTRIVLIIPGKRT